MTQLYDPYVDWAREDAETGVSMTGPDTRYMVPEEPPSASDWHEPVNEPHERRTAPRWQVEKIMQAIADGSLIAPDQQTWETTTAQVQLGDRDITQAELRAIWELVEGGFATWGSTLTLTPSGEQWLTRLKAFASYTTAAGERSHAATALDHLAEVTRKHPSAKI